MAYVPTKLQILNIHPLYEHSDRTQVLYLFHSIYFDLTVNCKILALCPAHYSTSINVQINSSCSSCNDAEGEL